MDKINEICTELKKILDGEVTVVPDLGQSRYDVAGLVVGKAIEDAGGNIGDAEVYSDEEGIFTTQDENAPNYSINESDRKVMNKAKKKQGKAVKGTENESDLRESFVVNEEVEDQIIEANTED